MPSFGSFEYTVDPVGTDAAYAQVEMGSSAFCECAYCRNFRAAFTQAIPATFVTWLREQGIDPAKDAEVFQLGWDDVTALHWYGGWYHFIGQLNSDEATTDMAFGNGLTAKIKRANGEPKLLGHIPDSDLLQVSFTVTAVPWLLDEPNPG